jgi:SAM-dependent methyltransferase
VASSWIAYNELAWTEDLLAYLADYEGEVAGYVDLIKRNSSHAPYTLLHLGCGAGGHDTMFKQHFAVTGVDISRGMLDKARLRHSDVEYIEGDMRTVRLGREFDAVAIPDSIDYMGFRYRNCGSLCVIETAVAHLKPGGILMGEGYGQRSAVFGQLKEEEKRLWPERLRWSISTRFFGKKSLR